MNNIRHHQTVMPEVLCQMPKDEMFHRLFFASRSSRLYVVKYYKLLLTVSPDTDEKHGYIETEEPKHKLWTAYKQHIDVAFIGAKGSGKSTIIGQLLYQCGSISQETLTKLAY